VVSALSLEAESAVIVLAQFGRSDLDLSKGFLSIGKRAVGFAYITAESVIKVQ
jgi:hypothetical protein